MGKTTTIAVALVSCACLLAGCGNPSMTCTIKIGDTETVYKLECDGAFIKETVTVNGKVQSTKTTATGRDEACTQEDLDKTKQLICPNNLAASAAFATSASTFLTGENATKLPEKEAISKAVKSTEPKANATKAAN